VNLYVVCTQLIPSTNPAGYGRPSTYTQPIRQPHSQKEKGEDETNRSECVSTKTRNPNRINKIFLGSPSNVSTPFVSFFCDKASEVPFFDNLLFT
jgi:hypothetical protein